MKRWRERRRLWRQMAVLEVVYRAERDRLSTRYTARRRFLERKLQDTYKPPR